jgi:hypothetical protein
VQFVTRRRWTWLVATFVVGAIDLAATINTSVHWHATLGGPSVITLGQLLGWVTSIALLVIAALIAISGRREQQRRARFARRVAAATAAAAATQGRVIDLDVVDEP